MTPLLRVGDRVLWRGAWGRLAPISTRVTRIELCEPGQRQKEGGTPVAAVPWTVVNLGVVVDLANGHWAYGDQLAPFDPEEGGTRR